MSRDDISKVLGQWVGKARPIGEPPSPEETRGSLVRSERPMGQNGNDDDLTQLNFKIPRSMKRHIKQLALRDGVKLVGMLYVMLELYEKEHGPLNT